MSNNYASGNPQGGNRQKKEVFNQWQAIGVLRPFKDGDPLKFTAWKNGGVLNARLAIVEPIGVDENGNPKTRKFSIKVSIKTNKNITAQQLQSLMAGTKVRIVSRLVYESYNDKSGAQRTDVCADVFVVEVLETPQMFPQQPQPQYYPGGYPQQYGQPAQPQYPGQYPPQGQPQYPQQPPQQPQYPGQYPPQGQPHYQHQPQYPPQGQGQQGGMPPVMPQGGQYPQQTPPWYKPAPSPVDFDDLPEA